MHTRARVTAMGLATVDSRWWYNEWKMDES